VRRSFHPLGSKSTNEKAPVVSDAMVHWIMAAPIQLTTMGQSTADWFNNRGMSLTSRSVEQGVAIFSGNEDELEHGGSWAFIKNYIAAAGSRSYSQPIDEESKEEEAGDQQDEQNHNDQENDDDGDDADIDDEFPSYTIDIDHLLDNDPDYVDEVVDHLLGAEYSDEQVMSVLRTIGATTSVAQTANRASLANRKKLEAWLNLPALLRPVYFQTAAKLRAFAKSLLPVCTLPAKASESVARNALAAHLILNPLTTVNSTDSAQPASASSLIAQLTKTQKLKRLFIVTAFLPKLETQERRDTRRGLDLEEPMVQNLLRDSAKQKTIFTIEEVAAAPLVCRTGLPIHSASCSLDFAAIICRAETGERELAGIECKGCVRLATAAAQRSKFKKAKE
jgi:hypothetical protein